MLNRVQDDAEVREQAVSAQISWGKVPTVGENAQMGIWEETWKRVWPSS